MSDYYDNLIYPPECPPEQEIVAGDALAKKLNEMYKKIAEQEDTYAKLQNDLADAREALLASRTESFRLYNDLAKQEEKR
jgi:septal ring factor EnvC (AmiA/AmiB activator)